MAEIKKILSLGTKDFLTGINPNFHLDNGAIWQSAKGINPFVDHNGFTSRKNIGLLQTSGAATAISGISQSIMTGGLIRPTGTASGKIYLIGNSGAFYSKDLNDDTAFTDLRSGNAISSPTGYMALFKAGSSQHLYYFQQTQIGRWDMSGTYPTGWTDNHFTGLTSTTNHFSHAFSGDLYYTNSTTIGKIFDNSGTATNNTNVLDLPSNMVARALEDDLNYLVVMANENTALGTYSATNKIYFWDTFSPSWNKEYTIHDPQIVALKRIRETIYAIGKRGIYAFDFNHEPRKVLPLSPGTTTGTAGVSMVDKLGEALVWDTTSPYLGFFGKVIPHAPTAYFQLLYASGLSGSINWFNVSARDDRFYFQGANSSIYYIDTTVGGDTSLSASTIYFDLKEEYEIKRIDVLFGEPLSSGDSLNVDIKLDEDTTATDWETASFTTHGAIKRVNLYGATPIKTDQLSLVLNFDAGNPKIKRIDVYGEPVSTI